MKVAIVVDTLHGGGAEKVCILLTRALLEKKIDVQLIVVKPLCDYDIDASLPVHFLLKDVNAKLYKKKSISQAAMVLRRLAYEAGGYDLVLSNLDGSHPVVSKANLNNVWYVVHNSIEEKLNRAKRMGPLKYFRQKSVYKYFNSQNLVAVSDGLRKELEGSRYVKPTSVSLIYNPVDIHAINSAVEHDIITSTERYILHVGRFARLKRHDLLFEAYRYLIHDLEQPLKLVLLCEESKKLSGLIKKYQLSDHVLVTGFQQDPYPWMKNAEALVLSSDGEGFGLVLVEAMLCGTPVVSTNCKHGPSEILSGELAKYLSPVGDPIALARNIATVLVAQPTCRDAEILTQIDPMYVANRYLHLLYGQAVSE